MKTEARWVLRNNSRLSPGRVRRRKGPSFLRLLGARLLRASIFVMISAGP